MAGLSSLIFKQLFSADSLEQTFREHFQTTRTRGVDRLTGPQFARSSVIELARVSEKVLGGAYKFTPYAEVLRTKGRGKAPRLIGIPTVRDRVVLYQVNRFLSEIYPAQVPRNLAKKTVASIVESLKKPDCMGDETWVCSTDIKTFYDSIDRVRLIKVLQRSVDCDVALRLIDRAILTPIVTRGSQRTAYAGFKRSLGVPQGLSISNILAAIYLMDVDGPMIQLGVKYWRYVDDVLMIGRRDDVAYSFESLRRRLRRRSLELHSLGSEKTVLKPVKSEFNYLGYRFAWPKITVKGEAVDRYLVGIAAMFSKFVQSKFEKIRVYAYLSEERLRDIFILELNDRIAGAISGRRRYGWVAYYNGINDLTLLKSMDHSISQMFRRLSEFDKKAPANLKKLSRAYYEMKYRPLGGYARNYDLIVTIAHKIQFLEARGLVAPDMNLDDAEVERIFSRYRRSLIDSMQEDEGSFYGA